MKSMRLVLGLTGLLTILAITATPASANFQALQPNTSQGPAQLVSNAVFTSGEAAITCGELSKGEWHIQTKFTKVVISKDGNTKVEQDLTKDGPHLQFTGGFTKCTALAGAVPVAVNPACSIQIIQISSTLGVGAVKTQCQIVLVGLNCEIHVLAGNPNTNLEKVELKNIVGGQEDKAEAKGITSTITGAGCAEIGVKANNANTFTAKVVAHSEKVE